MDKTTKPATAEDVKSIVTEVVGEASKAILEGMDTMFGERDKRFNSIENTLKDNTKRLDKIESEVFFIKQDVKDIKADLSDTPSRREFNDLKTKVEEHLAL